MLQPIFIVKIVLLQDWLEVIRKFREAGFPCWKPQEKYFKSSFPKNDHITCWTAYYNFWE